MTKKQIEDAIVGLSDSERTRLIADNWCVAQSGLCGITNDARRAIPVSQYPLQVLCILVGHKDHFHGKTSAEKEQIVEQMKAVLKPVKPLLKNRADMTLPSYSVVSNLTPQNGERCFFC